MKPAAPVTRILLMCLQVDGAVAVAAGPVHVVQPARRRTATTAVKGRDEAKLKLDGPDMNPDVRIALRQAACDWLETIRSTPRGLKKAGCAANDFGGVRRRGETIGDRAQPHSGRSACGCTSGCSRARPSRWSAPPVSPAGGRSGHRRWDRGSAEFRRSGRRAHAVVVFASVPQLVGPAGELLDDLGACARRRRAAGARTA